MTKRKNRPDGSDPIPIYPRAMEKEIQELGRQLRGKEFESVEEAQAFLEEMIASGEGLQPVPAAPSTPLEKAQDLVYQAFETESHRKRVQLAKKALKVSPIAPTRTCCWPKRRPQAPRRPGSSTSEG